MPSHLLVEDVDQACVDPVGRDREFNCRNTLWGAGIMSGVMLVWPSCEVLAEANGTCKPMLVEPRGGPDGTPEDVDPVLNDIDED